MDNFVITIARGFGSGGKQVGLALAEKLGIPCYERQIIEMSSHYSGINKSLFSQVDEQLRGYNLIKKLMKIPANNDIISPAKKSFVSDENLYKIQAKIIRELAKNQSCVIVGKCANYILRDFDNVASFYIEAPRDACVKSICERMGVTKEEANKMIVQTDKYRSDYYKYLTGGENWMSPIAYDMTINSARAGRDKCADIIIGYTKLKFGADVFEKKGTEASAEALKQLGIVKA
ncbi:MAG: cytidylate kinase-like family protein [Eubacterium sp.]|nr:cytidylate kinase-like family protein [Eubacterium sp.]